MIEFVKGPHGEIIDEKEKQYIIAAFKKDSKAMRINAAYNNGWHFSNFIGYDTNTFIREVQRVADSKVDKIIVHGGIHTDSYGHTSGLIGQLEFSQYGTQYYPVITRDTYVHFTVVTQGIKAFNAIDTTNAFHFLIEVPHIIQLHSHPKTPILVRTEDTYVYPSVDPKLRKHVKFISV